MDMDRKHSLKEKFYGNLDMRSEEDISEDNRCFCLETGPQSRGRGKRI